MSLRATERSVAISYEQRRNGDKKKWGLAPFRGKFMRERKKCHGQERSYICHCEEQRRFLRFARNRLRNLIKRQRKNEKKNGAWPHFV